jgi:hypothetical protein
MNFADTTFDIDQAIAEWKAEKIAKNFYAKWDADEATDADVAEYHNRYATEVVAEVVATEVAKPITAMTPVEQVALSQARAVVENIRWDEINAAAIVAMNTHAPSANLAALRKYLAAK